MEIGFFFQSELPLSYCERVVGSCAGDMEDDWGIVAQNHKTSFGRDHDATCNAKFCVCSSPWIAVLLRLVGILCRIILDQYGEGITTLPKTEGTTKHQTTRYDKKTIRRSDAPTRFDVTKGNVAKKSSSRTGRLVDFGILLVFMHSVRTVWLSDLSTYNPSQRKYLLPIGSCLEPCSTER